MKGRFWLVAGGVLALGVVVVVPPAVLLYLLRSRPQLLVSDDRIQSAVRSAINADIHDIELARYRKALLEAAEFVDEHLADKPGLPDRYQLLKYSLEQVDPNRQGLYCEFGVAEGASIRFIASVVPGRQIHGFDSFEGLPEHWRQGHDKGVFKVAQLPQVPSNVVLHKGWFDKSLPLFRDKYKDLALFFHLDADLYSSTKTVFDVLGDRVGPGTILVFDEFIGFPGWKQGEYRAFTEFAQARGIGFEYLGWCPRGQQVAVRVRTTRPEARSRPVLR